MNPIIDSLQRELLLLDSGDMTWRPQTGRCETIRTIQEYVDPTQWPNLQDFLAEHSHSIFIPRIQQHDSKLEELNAVANLIFNRILSWGQFLDEVSAALEKYESQRASLGPQAPSFIHMREEIPKIVAEYLINNRQSLPSHYVISPFWNFAGKSIIAFRNLPEFGSLHRLRDGLSEVSAKLKQELESHRLTLSRTHDVPAAPFPGVSFEE
ncbi:MAG TPA: hypothetical protein VGT03_13685 [Candidatus Acidoferrales bacterium]|nr:hypothetical protein [Candidatus Acidoferrales bacterium]